VALLDDVVWCLVDLVHHAEGTLTGESVQLLFEGGDVLELRCLRLNFPSFSIFALALERIGGATFVSAQKAKKMN
jgi:hypothetical protein